MKPLTFLSLFAGIGGLDLGLERAGMTCTGQVEIDPYCQRVLAKHWPEVPRHDDVRSCAGWWGDRPAPDVVCGGFPCQPFSLAGSQRGVADERWLWPAFADVVRAVRPRYVLVENVTDLARDPRAFGWLLGDLHDFGFDADWSILPACAVGATHARERVFLVAYRPNCHVSDHLSRSTPRQVDGPELGGGGGGSWRHRWLPEPALDRVAHGVPSRMVRDPLHALGNAVVPAVAEYVGRLVVEHAATLERAA